MHLWHGRDAPVPGGHQGEGKDRRLSLPLHWLLPPALQASNWLLRWQASPVLQAGLITRAELFLELSKTKTLLSLCPGGKSCFSHSNAFAFLCLPGTPSPTGNPTCPLPPAFVCSLPFGGRGLELTPHSMTYVMWPVLLWNHRGHDVPRTRRFE